MKFKSYKILKICFIKMKFLARKCIKILFCCKIILLSSTLSTFMRKGKDREHWYFQSFIQNMSNTEKAGHRAKKFLQAHD